MAPLAGLLATSAPITETGVSGVWRIVPETGVSGVWSVGSQAGGTGDGRGRVLHLAAWEIAGRGRLLYHKLSLWCRYGSRYGVAMGALRCPTCGVFAASERGARSDYLRVPRGSAKKPEQEPHPYPPSIIPMGLVNARGKGSKQ